MLSLFGLRWGGDDYHWKSRSTWNSFYYLCSELNREPFVLQQVVHDPPVVLLVVVLEVVFAAAYTIVEELES